LTTQQPAFSKVLKLERWAVSHGKNPSTMGFSFTSFGNKKIFRGIILWKKN